ncbi:MAG: hypothetical protein OEV92_05170 [Nitrospinota bacterium]|nr:hypothetical protein [Nitrospinota bacterium]
MNDKSTSSVSRIFRYAMLAAWVSAVGAMAGYSIYATVDTVIVYRQIPQLDVRKTVAKTARDKYAKVIYLLSRIEMVKRLTKNCRKYAEENRSYLDAEEVRLYQKFQQQDRAGNHEEAKSIMESVKAMLKEKKD